ncbi:MAG: PIG-L family deacetylase [Burkholderiaceae bacterium]
MDPVARERLIAGESTSEAVWSNWLHRLCVQAWDWRSELQSAACLVVVAPHPDDELLACGGLLAMHARSGGKCRVLAVTDGEASHGRPSCEEMAELSRLREQERARGLESLGIDSASSVQRLYLPDGQVAQHADRLVELTAAALGPDDLVITTWKLDGHPDHDSVGFCVARACRRVGCRMAMAPVWMWHWAFPADERVPWHRMRSVTLDAQAVQSKTNALAAHHSQLAARCAGVEPILGPEILARSGRSHEYFFV